MECDKCKSKDIRVWISVQMYIDFEDYGRLTKQVIKKKSTTLWSTDYDRTKFICCNCRHAW